MQDFEQTYTDYFQDVFRYMRSLCRNDLTAEEITEETFFKALKNIETFDRRCDIRTWLIQIAKNIYCSYLKKNKRLAEFPMPENSPARILYNWIQSEDGQNLVRNEGYATVG